MSSRTHPRVPFAVQVEFRTPSSFLVAYSVNLSQGGIFLETAQAVAVGTPVGLVLHIPKVGPVQMSGVVTWQRDIESPDGPPGIGIEFEELDPANSTLLAEAVDRLVASYAGIHVMLLVGDRQARTALTRLVKSIFATADIHPVADPRQAQAEISATTDLVIVDVDFDIEGGLGVLRTSRTLAPAIPAVAIATTKKLREHARAAGADEIVSNPPSFNELQLAIVRAISRPSAVR